MRYLSEAKPSTAELLTALKEEADASFALNEDDLRRRTKPMFLSEPAHTEEKGGALFKKRSAPKARPPKR